MRRKGIYTGQHHQQPQCLTRAAVCNQLYLTPPGKLWSNHTPPTKDPRESNQHAVHVPLCHTTAHNHLLWTVWTGIKDTHTRDYTSTERKSKQLLNEAFATSKTDRSLDEYIKTVSPPIVGQTTASYNTTCLSQEECLQKTKTLLLQDHRRNTDTHASHRTISTTNPSPMSVQQHAITQREHIRTMHKQTDSSWYPVTFKRVTDASSAYTVFPLRARQLQELSTVQGQNTLCMPTVTTPLHVATVVLETLELHLESLLSVDASLKSTDYRRQLTTLCRLLRRVVTRGGVVEEWVADLQEYECDLGEITPNADQLARRQAYQYMTPVRLLSSLLRNVDMLCTNTTEMHYLMMLQETKHSRWWCVDHDKLYPSRMNLAWMHELVQNNSDTHVSERARQDIVRHTLHNKTNDETIIQQYAHRYEQLVRAQSMSNSAFRKDDGLMTIIHTIRNLPNSYTLKAIQKQHPPQQRHHHTTANMKKSVSTKMKTVRITLNNTDRVPQEINVTVKKNKKNKKRSPTTHNARTMTNATTTTSNQKTTPVVSVSKLTSTNKTKPSDVNAKTKNNTKNKTKNNTKNKKNGGNKTKTIIISTASATGTENNLTDAINITTSTKNSNEKARGGARYLTTDEVDAYRSGLQKHIKQKGGGTFVQEQQKTQQKKHPGFHFDAIVDTENVHYANIKQKLQLSAKNRNALRKVKREILRSFGGHRTFKHIKNKNSNKTTTLQQDKNGYRGSLYTRKNTGGTSPNLPSTPSVTRVTWNENDSLGDKIRDASTNDAGTTAGLSTIDLSGLEEVVID